MRQRFARRYAGADPTGRSGSVGPRLLAAIRPWVSILIGMPRDEYRCRTCEGSFEQVRPMSEANAPTPCPQGHVDTVKLLSTVAMTGRAAGGSVPAAGAGCCGGACGCGH